jgi:hypothetical protein
MDHEEIHIDEELHRPYSTGFPYTFTKIVALSPAVEVMQLTGAATIAAGQVSGADLGHLFDLDNRLYIVFGDSYGPGSDFPPGRKDLGREPILNDWRSNTMASVSSAQEFLQNGLRNASMIMDRDSHAKELIPGLHQPNDGRGEVTKIPTSGVAVGETMFLHYMSVKKWVDSGKWDLNYSSLAYSDNKGQDWNLVPFKWEKDGNFGQVAFVRGDQLPGPLATSYIYMFGIPAGRFGGVKLARVPATRESLLNPESYSYYREEGASRGWVKGTEKEWMATELVPRPVGEFSVIYNRHFERWIMLYFDNQSIMLREAPNVTGLWSPPQQIYTGGAIYAPFMHPSLVENDGEFVYFTMSRWETYQVYLMKVHLGTDALLALRMVGIDFSVSGAVLRQWLNNSDTPYPAIAGALLNLLEGKRLRQPVYLDVIVWNYEHAPGASSPRSVVDVDLPMLRTAVVEGYNTRYGEAVRDFQSLVR